MKPAQRSGFLDIALDVSERREGPEETKGLFRAWREQKFQRAELCTRAPGIVPLNSNGAQLLLGEEESLETPEVNTRALLEHEIGSCRSIETPERTGSWESPKQVLESLIRPKLDRNALSKHRDESGDLTRDALPPGCWNGSEKGGYSTDCATLRAVFWSLLTSLLVTRPPWRFGIKASFLCRVFSA